MVDTKKPTIPQSILYFVLNNYREVAVVIFVVVLGIWRYHSCNNAVCPEGTTPYLVNVMKCGCLVAPEHK